MISKTLKISLLILLALYFLYCVLDIAVNQKLYQWDFRMQYHAARLLAEGQNPYDEQAMQKALNTDKHTLWYAYPPATLWFYRLFTYTNFQTAYNLFLILKACAIIALVILWQKKFIPQLAGVWFYIFCLFVFNGTMYLDLESGNINMFEELLLWIGFYFFINRRLLPFCLFILLASCFKITPIAFLLLLPLTDSKKKYLYFLGSCAVFLAYFLIQYAASPMMFQAFLNGANATLTERGVHSPSTTAFVTSFFNLLSYAGLVIPLIFRYLILLVIIILILIVSVKALLKLKSVNTNDGRLMLLFFFCLAYALLHPRMKDYAYILLIVPSFYIISASGFSKTFPFLYALSVLSGKNIMPGFAMIYLFMWTYYPLILSVLIWGLYLYQIKVTMDRKGLYAK
jgi:hypothetical protein